MHLKEILASVPRLYVVKNEVNSVVLKSIPHVAQ